MITTFNKAITINGRAIVTAFVNQCRKVLENGRERDNERERERSERMGE